MASDFLYENLPVNVRLDSSGQYYQFGVVMDGAYVVIFNRKTGGVNDDITRAKAAADEAKASKSSKSKSSAPTATE